MLVDAKAKALVTLLGLVTVVGSVTLWHEVFVIENPVAEGFAPTLLAIVGFLTDAFKKEKKMKKKMKKKKKEEEEEEAE